MRIRSAVSLSLLVLVALSAALFAAEPYLVPLTGSLCGADGCYRTEMTVTNLGVVDSTVTVGAIYPAPGRECRRFPVLSYTVHPGDTIPFNPVGCEFLGAYELTSTEPLAFTLDVISADSRQPIQVVARLFPAGTTAVIPGIQISVDPPGRSNLFIVGSARTLTGTLRRRQQLTGAWLEMPVTFFELYGGVHIFPLPAIPQECDPRYACPTEYELEIHSDESFYAGVSSISGPSHIWRPAYGRNSSSPPN